MGKYFIILDWEGSCNLTQNPEPAERQTESGNVQIFGNIQSGAWGETLAAIQTRLTGVWVSSGPRKGRRFGVTDQKPTERGYSLTPQLDSSTQQFHF